MELPVGKGLAIVVAVARNGVIGKDGGLPWRLPEDLKHFRAVTTGHAIVMGRKTWDSIGRPLPQRRSIVVTRDPTFAAVGAEVAHDLGVALDLAFATDDEPRVIGGGQIYAAALPLATALYLTEVDQDVDGDVFFPTVDRAAFREVARRTGETPGVTFVELRR